MQDKEDAAPTIVFLLAAVTAAIYCSALWAGDISRKKEKSKSSSEPVLYFGMPDSNSTEMVVAEANTVFQAVAPEPADSNLPATAKLNLVVATHGWYEKKSWPKDLALAIKSKVDSKKWLCGWYDWRHQAKRINPTDAAKYGRDVAGPLLGEKIVQLSKDWQHIHLIGHSAGSWVISEAAKIIARETNASLHLTFLDTYVPLFWHEENIADFGSEPNVIHWADHYFTRDITLGTTQKRLPRAHNVDLTDVNPDINDHEFPRYWYHATVIGQYAIGQRYEGKRLFNVFETIEYGFARSLEANRKNWKANIALKPGNKPVRIKRAKKPVKLQPK